MNTKLRHLSAKILGEGMCETKTRQQKKNEESKKIPKEKIGI